jgi:protoporphyrinogen oxidase
MFKKKGGEVETSLIEQFIYPKKGPGQLYEKMADEIVRLGGEILYGRTVNKITLADGKVATVSALNAENEVETYTADYFISSMPIKDLLEAIGKDVAPQDVYEIATELPYRDFMTVGLLLDSLKVVNKTKMKTLNNIVPDCWIYVQDRDVRVGRIQIFNNWSPYMVEDPENNIWVGLEYFCSEGDEFWKMDDRAFIDKCIDELKTAGLIADDTKIFDAVRIRTLKAYPAYFGTYSEFSKVREWLDSFANLYCIGRNGQHRYNNMDHSMLCGLEAAKALVAGSGKSSLWSVNTEEEYHETKK